MNMSVGNQLWYAFRMLIEPSQVTTHTVESDVTQTLNLGLQKRYSLLTLSGAGGRSPSQCSMFRGERSPAARYRVPPAQQATLK